MTRTCRSDRRKLPLPICAFAPSHQWTYCLKVGLRLQTTNKLFFSCPLAKEGLKKKVYFYCRLWCLMLHPDLLMISRLEVLDLLV